MGLSHWKDPDARVAYQRAYESSLGLWPAPLESRSVGGRFGDTHVLAFLANLFIRTGSLLPLPATVNPGLRGMMGGSLPDPRIVRQMELGVAGFRYDRAGIYPSAFPDDEIARIVCPTLVLLGDREMIYDPSAAAERARALIPGCSVEVISGVGHLLGMQGPDLVNARLASFLGSDARREAVSAVRPH